MILSGEFQIMTYEDNKRKLEAYTVILGTLDPTLSTLEGLKERYEKVREEKFGPQEPDEPGEIEKEVAKVVKSILERDDADDELYLDDEENVALARIYIEEDGRKRVILDDSEEDTPEPSVDDTFSFYVFRGRVCVDYNDSADCDFDTFPKRFQEKVLEIVKKRFEEEGNE